jgi:hypothetical protein
LCECATQSCAEGIIDLFAIEPGRQKPFSVSASGFRVFKQKVLPIQIDEKGFVILSFQLL